MTNTILAAATNGINPLWYATRAGGTIALLLLTASVVLGIAVAGQAPARPSVGSRVSRFEVGLLHRNLSLLALMFLLTHIITAVIDPYVHLGWTVAVIPFLAQYRPPWLGLGTVAFDLIAAILITSALRFRLGRRRWKAVHALAYAAWLVAIVHALGTGTDTRLVPQLWLYATCIAAVTAATCWRLWRAGPGHAARRLTAALATLAIPVLITAFLAHGPLQPGWSKRAALPLTSSGSIR